MYSDLGIVIAAGGSARRFGGGNKLLLELAGVPLFLHSVRRFLPLVKPGFLVVVVPAADRARFLAAADRFGAAARIRWVEGGATRSASVEAGLAALPPEAAFVAIHDAARPLADAELLDRLLPRAREVGGAVPGKPVTDTLKRTAPDGVVIATVDRDCLWRVETPQVFELEKLRRAYLLAAGREFSDDAGVMEAAGFATAVVENPSDNTKLTFRRDVARLERLLAE